MPSYEAILILKKLAKPELAKVLKRAATHICNNQGLLFGIENLGHRPLPYSISRHGRRHREGSYFVIRYDSNPTSMDVLRDEFHRDIDIIRYGFVKLKAEEKFDCTLDEEMKPPAYREDVKKMIEEGRKKERFQHRQMTGLDYNPFRT